MDWGTGGLGDRRIGGLGDWKTGGWRTGDWGTGKFWDWEIEGL